MFRSLLIFLTMRFLNITERHIYCNKDAQYLSFRMKKDAIDCYQVSVHLVDTVAECTFFRMNESLEKYKLSDADRMLVDDCHRVCLMLSLIQARLD